jgi:hypothetical protein
MSSSVILLEFNELCPTLMAQFMQQGHLPNFQRFYHESAVYTTDAAEQPPYLEPWIQWVTVHTGQPYAQHQIFSLDEGHKLTFPSIWDTLSAAGHRVWVCGSMNLRYDAPINGHVLPDYWATQQSPYPAAEFQPFFQFVRRQVQEHTNDTVRLGWRDYAQFLRFMVTHGLSWKTMGAIAQQLVKERLTGHYRWQRATLLDQLQRDVFCWYHRRFKPDFSTFFLNSTAHFQHMYWRNMAPQDFQVQPSTAAQGEYASAILYGYQRMDAILGDLLRLADDHTTVILCTALSQQPCLTYEATGGKHLYRPRRFQDLLAFAGVSGAYDCSPVMAEEFFIRFATEAEAQVAERQLAALRVDQRPAMRLRRQGNEIYAGCGIFESLPEPITLSSTVHSHTTPFFQIFYPIDDIKSGMHHPDGILWIRDPALQHSVHTEKVPLDAIAPTILNIVTGNPPVQSPVGSMLPASVSASVPSPVPSLVSHA